MANGAAVLRANTNCELEKCGVLCLIILTKTDLAQRPLQDIIAEYGVPSNMVYPFRSHVRDHYTQWSQSRDLFGLLWAMFCSQHVYSLHRG